MSRITGKCYNKISSNTKPNAPQFLILLCLLTMYFYLFLENNDNGLVHKLHLPLLFCLSRTFPIKQNLQPSGPLAAGQPVLTTGTVYHTTLLDTTGQLAKATDRRWYRYVLVWWFQRDDDRTTGAPFYQKSACKQCHSHQPVFKVLKRRVIACSVVGTI